MTLSTRRVRLSVRLGLTLYVAFLLTQAASAAQRPALRPQPVSPQAPPEPPPAREGHTVGPDSSAGQYPAGGSSMRQVPPPGSPTPYGPLPPPAPPFRDTPYGAHANPGPPGSPGFLHPHFPEYQTRYGIWYQPDSFHESTKAVYRPSPFRPRGWGNLFYEPCRPDRMDYARAVVDDLPSRYGPAYYPHYTEPSECLVRPTRRYVPPVWGAAEAHHATR